MFSTRFSPKLFFKKLGAELVYGDLSKPSTLPNTLKGVEILIDASTLRPTSNYTSEVLDWRGKLALIEAGKLIGLKKFIFFSILNAKNNPKIPLLNLKTQIEKKIRGF